MTIVPPSETERNLQRLETEIRRLEIEYNSYFAGHLRTPPWETRRRVEGMIKQFDRAYIPNYGERFRFLTLQTRAVKLAELWDRGMRSREEGRGGATASRRSDSPVSQAPTEPEASAGARSSAASGPSAVPGVTGGSPASDAGGADRARAIVHETALTFKDPAAEREKLRGLYDSLQQARDQVGERNRLPFDQFADLIQSQVEKLQSGGRSAVAFRVKVEDGKVKVTAKAVKDAGHDGER